MNEGIHLDLDTWIPAGAGAEVKGHVNYRLRFRACTAPQVQGLLHEVQGLFRRQGRLGPGVYHSHDRVCTTVMVGCVLQSYLYESTLSATVSTLRSRGPLMINVLLLLSF